MEKTTDEALRFVGWLQHLPHSNQVLPRVQGRCAPWPWTRAALLAVAQADAEPARCDQQGSLDFKQQATNTTRYSPKWYTFGENQGGSLFDCQMGTFSIVKV